MADVTDDLGLYRTMVRIRTFEARAGERFAENEIPGFIHLSIGQESVAAGVIGALDDTDYITATHRGHGHIIAKGGELGPMMAELYGRREGYCKGKSGSMHIFSFDLGVLGANGILGAGQPIACGAALSAKRRGSQQVVATFFGEGASAQGAVHEAMNLAGSWRLPVLFVAELNGWAELSPSDTHMPVESLTTRAPGYGFGASAVDGLDVRDVHRATAEALEVVRAGDPHLLEVRTHRWHGHFEGDPQRYRDEEDLATLSERDPIAFHRRRLIDEGVDAGVLDEIDADAERAVAEAIDFARAGSWPEPSEMFEDVYATSSGVGR